MAISGRLLTTHGNVPQVPNEKSIEYEVLSGFQEDSGDFAGSLESLREALALKEGVQKSTPEYPNIRSGIAIVRVESGDDLARLGSREEAFEVQPVGHGSL
jgi:hypothetical protein